MNDEDRKQLVFCIAVIIVVAMIMTYAYQHGISQIQPLVVR